MAASMSRSAASMEANACGVVRSAASAAASTSMARRSSMTSSTSPDGDEAVRIDAEGHAAGVGRYERARALPRDYQAFGAQGGHRLAHDGAAYAHGLHEFLLGRQPGPRFQPAAADFAGNARDDLLHQVAGRPQRLQ